MQLTIKRSQKRAALSGSAIFCLDARVLFTRPELDSVTRYKLHSECVYNSEASKRHLAALDAGNNATMGGAVKGLMHAVAANMHLNVTVNSLQNGQHIECKSLEELLGAEDAIMQACRSLKSYLDAAATFDGRQVLYEFTGDEPSIIASSASPQPVLASSSHAPTVSAQTTYALPAPTASASSAAAVANPQALNKDQLILVGLGCLAVAIIIGFLVITGHVVGGVLFGIASAFVAMMYFSFRSP
jgi:hypothetical protein